MYRGGQDGHEEMTFLNDGGANIVSYSNLFVHTSSNNTKLKSLGIPRTVQNHTPCNTLIIYM